jgi:TPR repeat protein
VRLYKLAADQGYAQAQVNLGVMYERGRGGLAKDEREALRLYKLAADQEDDAGKKSVERTTSATSGAPSPHGRREGVK